MIYDSDVLIWATRGNFKAARIIDRDESPMVSIVSRLELFQGARDKRELGLIRRFLHRFKPIPLSENIGLRASVYMEEYTLKSGLDVCDALIAATAAEHDIPLCSGNAKHFRPIAEVTLKTFRP